MLWVQPDGTLRFPANAAAGGPRGREVWLDDAVAAAVEEAIGSRAEDEIESFKGVCLLLQRARRRFPR